MLPPPIKPSFFIVGPLAENRPPDAHDRRAFLNRDLEVIGHSHRKLA